MLSTKDLQGMEPNDPQVGYFAGAVRRWVPSGAFTVWGAERGRVVVQVAWPLPGGSSGVPKYSHPVRIILTREALEDYMQGKPAKKQIAERRFDEWLRRRLEGFQPMAGQPFGGPRMQEWVVLPNDLI